MAISHNRLWELLPEERASASLQALCDLLLHNIHEVLLMLQRA
jgi:hypothetical protein